MEKEFASVMQQRSDAELIEIVTRAKEDYLPKALEAAQLELQKRNLSPEKLEAAKKQAEENQRLVEQKANEPLEVHWKILCLLFPGIINFFLAFIFQSQGHHRKFKQAWKWTFYGFGFYMGLVLLVGVLSSF